ncbi:MAG: hypothetical protein HQ582_24425 [Planctomycetes bacterium]|nr:hypothetical protein [Planctomycetota bacterium]
MIRNHGPARECELVQRLATWKDARSVGQPVSRPLRLAADEEQLVEQVLPVPNAVLWSPDTPMLYTLATRRKAPRKRSSGDHRALALAGRSRATPRGPLCPSRASLCMPRNLGRSRVEPRKLDLSPFSSYGLSTTGAVLTLGRIGRFSMPANIGSSSARTSSSPM